MKQYLKKIRDMLYFRYIKNDSKEDNALDDCDKEWYGAKPSERVLYEKFNRFDEHISFSMVEMAWKDYHQKNKHKKKRLDFSYTIRNETITGFTWRSSLRSIHHLIYLIALGKDFEKSFCERSLKQLYRKYSWITTYSSISTIFEKLKEPFGDSLTDKQLISILNYFKEYCKNNEFTMSGS